MKFFGLLLLAVAMGFVGYNFDNANRYPIWLTLPLMFGVGCLVGRGFLALVEEERW